MSATTPPVHHKKRHAVLHHARQPYGIAIIGGLIFVVAWAIWTFVYSSPIPI